MWRLRNRPNHLQRRHITSHCIHGRHGNGDVCIVGIWREHFVIVSLNGGIIRLYPIRSYGYRTNHLVICPLWYYPKRVIYTIVLHNNWPNGRKRYDIIRFCGSFPFVGLSAYSNSAMVYCISLLLIIVMTGQWIWWILHCEWDWTVYPDVTNPTSELCDRYTTIQL